MPVDLQLTFKDGTAEMHHIPLNLMFGSKQSENANLPFIVHEAWRWTHPTYVVEFKRKLPELVKVELDPSKRMADIERKNNLMELSW